MAESLHEIDVPLSSDADSNGLAKDDECVELTTDTSQLSEEACVGGDGDTLAEARILYCDPCREEGNEQIAEGFCVDCNDYLCNNCFTVHRKPKVWKHHVLQDNKCMPSSKPSTPPSMMKTQFCPNHKDETVQLYCEEHDAAFCVTCGKMLHRQCKKTGNVFKISNELLDDGELQNVKVKLVGLKQQFQHNSDATVQHVDNIRTSFDTVVTSLTKIRDSDILMANDLRDTCDKMVAGIKSVEDDLVACEEKDNKVQTFVALKQIQSSIKSFEENLALVRKDNKLFEYTFSSYSDTRCYGEIGNLFRAPKEISRIDIHTENSEDCHITGMEIMSNNKVVVADNTNSKLKTIDLATGTISSDVDLTHSPWDLTSFGDGEIAVSSADRDKIYILFASDQLSIKQTLRVGYKHGPLDNSKLSGITCTKDSLVVCNKTTEIQISDMQGTLKNTVSNKDNAAVLTFGAIKYIALGPDENTLFLSDYKNNKVLNIDLTGKVVSSLQHERMNNLQGIAVGQNGRVFVCSRDDNSILELSSDLSECEVILEEADGVDSPQSILYDEKDCRLLIGDRVGSVMVFQV